MNNSTIPKNGLVVSTPSEREIVLTRTFNAPRDLVFQALSQPEHIRRWWGMRDDVLIECAMDFRVGGAWRFVMRNPDGQEHGFRGQYREIAPVERIVQTFEFEGMPGHISLETLALDEHDGRTTMTITCQFDSTQARDAMLGSGMEIGAGQSYDRLEELLQTLV